MENQLDDLSELVSQMNRTDVEDREPAQVILIVDVTSLWPGTISITAIVCDGRFTSMMQTKNNARPSHHISTGAIG